MTDHDRAHQSGNQNEPASKRVSVLGVAIAVRVIGRVIAGVCIAFVATGCKDKENAPAKPTNVRASQNPGNAVETPNIVEPRELIRVTAEKLDEDFDADEMAANAKYKNKVIEVSGRVHKIDRTDASRVTLELQLEDDDTVDCDFLPKDAHQLAALEVGQAVVIRGKCLGKVDDTVTLDLCSLVK